MLVLCMVIFFGLLAIGCPIVLCMGISSGSWLLLNEAVPDLVIAQKMFTSADSFTLMAVPFFMLAGQIMDRSGITEVIIDFADTLVGHIRGGLGHTCELAGALMATISGSSNAGASALGAMLLKGLKNNGYDSGMAGAIVASAASLGPIIPPSIIMILYGNAIGENIGALFMSGALPGVLLCIGYMIVVYVYAVKHNIPKRDHFAGWNHVFHSFLNAFFALLMPVINIGGILAGVVTATEAGVVASLYGIIYGLVRRRLTFRDIIEAVRGAVISAASPLAIIRISSIFSYVLAREGLTAMIANFCANSITSPFAFMIFVIAVCLVAGCFVDGTAVMLLLTPIFYPISQSMGIPTLQFSIIFMIAIMSGGLTPPVGSVLFVTAGVHGDPLGKIAKAIIPFVCVLVIVEVILLFVPQLATFVPSLFGY